MKTKKFWKWTNEALNEPNETRNLEVYGTIAESSWFDDEITPQIFKDELFHGKGPVTIWINSPGGDCIAASQIYTMLMEYPGEVTVKIDGLAASAASVIAMAGSKVLMAPTAMMMIHNPMTNAFGDHVEMQKAIEMLEEVKESIINAYEIKTSLSRAKLSRLMDEETWMNAYKAIELGFADALLEDKKTANMKDSYVFSQRKVDAALLNKMTAKTKHKANQPTGRNVDELKNQLKVMEKLFNLGGKVKMTINELLEKRKAKWEAMNAFLNTHRNEKGVLSAEDDKLYSAMETEMVELTNEIERMNRAAALEKIMSKPVSEPITLKPMSSDDHKEDKTGRSSKAYKDALMKALRTNFRSISNVLQENVDTDGGYLVPEEIDGRLIEKLETENIIRLLGTSIETSGDHKINIAASKPAAAWTDEGETITFDDAKFSQILLDAHKLCVAVKVTEELLYDSAFDLENYLTSAFAKALANAEENAFLNGNGVGKPLGIFANTGGAEIGVTTSGNTPTYDEIINLVYSLKRPYRKNAAFIMNDSTIAVIRKLKDGNGSYIWQPSSVAGEPDKILGYPVYTSAYVPEISAGNKVIAFGDFSYYNIGDRGTRSFSQLKELFAGNGLVGFVAKERVDGKLVLPEAVKVLKIKD